MHLFTEWGLLLAGIVLTNAFASTNLNDTTRGNSLQLYSNPTLSACRRNTLGLSANLKYCIYSIEQWQCKLTASSAKFRKTSPTLKTCWAKSCENLSPPFPHLLHHTLQRGCWMVEAFPLGQKEEAEKQAQQQAEQAELDLDPVGWPFKRAKNVILLRFSNKAWWCMMRALFLKAPNTISKQSIFHFSESFLTSQQKKEKTVQVYKFKHRIIDHDSWLNQKGPKCSWNCTNLLSFHLSRLAPNLVNPQ